MNAISLVTFLNRLMLVSCLVFSSPCNSLCLLQVSASYLFVWGSLFHAQGFLQVPRNSELFAYFGQWKGGWKFCTCALGLVDCGFHCSITWLGCFLRKPKAMCFHLLFCADASCKEEPPNLLPADQCGVSASLPEPVEYKSGFSLVSI